jgi:hypothetical protein
MTIMLCLFGLGAALELLLVCAPFVWRFRRVLAILAVLPTAFAAGGIALLYPNVFVLLIVLTSLMRAFNMIRVVEGRMHERYLHRATRRSTLVLLGLQVIIMLALLIWEQWHTTGQATWTSLTMLQLGVAVSLLLSTVRSLKRTTWPRRTAHLSDAELPTVTVAIPARNETEDLKICLESIIANDYPKLEIVVLDDCSQTRRTPEIIREFAHAGVRFVQGEEPDETWLPKNQAYNRLVEEANGEYIVFCGKDIRFERGTLRLLVATLLTKRKQMMSILPERAKPLRNHTVLAQAMRYFWEIAPPRRLFHRPPVLSSCWIIQRKALQDLGGFAAVARSITPEAHFARQLTKGDGYSFMRNGDGLGLTSMKGVPEQRDTAIRTRYPQLRRRPENVLITTFLEAVFLLLPFALAISGYWLGIGLPAIVLAATAALTLTVTYELISLHTHLGTWPFGLIALPAIVVYDIGIAYISMWQYEFSIVEWKGRNICVPAMHVIPHLPKIQ